MKRAKTPHYFPVPVGRIARPLRPDDDVIQVLRPFYFGVDQVMTIKGVGGGIERIRTLSAREHVDGPIGYLNVVRGIDGTPRVRADRGVKCYGRSSKRYHPIVFRHYDAFCVRVPFETFRSQTYVK